MNLLVKKKKKTNEFGMTTTAESHVWIALKSVAGQLLLEGEKKNFIELHLR